MKSYLWLFEGGAPSYLVAVATQVGGTNSSMALVDPVERAIAKQMSNETKILFSQISDPQQSVVPAPSRGDLNASSLLVTADSFLPLRLFCKEPINNFHIAMHLLGSMNLFSDFAAILEGL